MEKMREEFEAWIDDVEELRAFDGLRMLNASERRHMFSAWQASRAGLVVELPTTALTGSIGMVRRDMLDKCRAAIEAAGVTVK